MNGGFVSNAVCDTCTTVVPSQIGLKEKLEQALSESKLQEYKATEENGQITIYAKGVPAHASTPNFGVNAAGVTMECLAKAGFEDDFVKFYNQFKQVFYNFTSFAHSAKFDNDRIFKSINANHSINQFFFHSLLPLSFVSILYHILLGLSIGLTRLFCELFVACVRG